MMQSDKNNRKSIEAYAIIYFKRFYLKKTFIN